MMQGVVVDTNVIISAALSDGGKRYPGSILSFACVNRRLHPTQKPVALLEYLIKTYTNENDVVLDNCFGSGSTLVAAANTNRRYIGFELEQKYFDIAERRLYDARPDSQSAAIGLAA